MNRPTFPLTVLCASLAGLLTSACEPAEADAIDESVLDSRAQAGSTVVNGWQQADCLTVNSRCESGPCFDDQWQYGMIWGNRVYAWHNGGPKSPVAYVFIRQNTPGYPGPTYCTEARQLGLWSRDYEAQLGGGRTLRVQLEDNPNQTPGSHPLQVTYVHQGLSATPPGYGYAPTQSFVVRAVTTCEHDPAREIPPDLPALCTGMPMQ